MIKHGTIRCTAAPSNLNNNPLPDHRNRGVNMITMDEECDLSGTIMFDGSAEAFAETSLDTPVITILLKAPLTMQTYQPGTVITILVKNEPYYDTRSMPWNYQTETKGRMIETVADQGLTRLRRCYAPEEPS